MKIKRIIVLVISIGILCNQVYAKYVYQFDETVIKLTRISNTPVCTVSYSTEEWTNQNVIVTITSNKEIEQASGFELSEDKKVLTKEVVENEQGIVKIRDYAGNCVEVEYNVANIDKEKPQIIGCENGGTYQKPLKLDYYDNVEIKDIFVEKYSDRLELRSESIFYNTDYYFGIDRTATTITVRATEHPKNTRKYRYYINDKLYATTKEAKYIFAGLTKGTTYDIKVEAIDAMGEVLDTQIMQRSTSYFEYATLTGTPYKQFTIWLNHVDNSLAKVRYYFWNCEDESNQRSYLSTVKDEILHIPIIHFNEEYGTCYKMIAYLYDSNGETFDTLEGIVDLSKKYSPSDFEPIINKYELTESGNYEIQVTDLAGNETIYDIKVE